MLQVNARLVKNNLPRVMRVVLRSQESMPKALADDVVEKARDIVPVRFGFLRDSIRASKVGRGEYQAHARSTEGGANRDYAHFVEYGTSKMTAQPFMRPAYLIMRRVTLEREVIKFGTIIEIAARS